MKQHESQVALEAMLQADADETDDEAGDSSDFEVDTEDTSAQHTSTSANIGDDQFIERDDETEEMDVPNPSWFDITEFEEEMREELDMEKLRQMLPWEAACKPWSPGKQAEWVSPQLGILIDDESFKYISRTYPFEFAAVPRKTQSSTERNFAIVDSSSPTFGFDGLSLAEEPNLLSVPDYRGPYYTLPASSAT